MIRHAFLVLALLTALPVMPASRSARLGAPVVCAAATESPSAAIAPTGVLHASVALRGRPGASVRLRAPSDAHELSVLSPTRCIATGGDRSLPRVVPGAEAASMSAGLFGLPTSPAQAPPRS